MTGSTGELWRYEARHCGRLTLALPVFAALVVAGAAMLAGRSWHDLLTGTAFPVLAGFAVADVAGREQAPELQSSVPRPYWSTMARRLALAGLAVTAGVVVLVTVLAVGAGTADPGWLFAQAWCSAMFLGGVAAAAGTRLRSVSAASVLVLVAWLAQFMVLHRMLGDARQEAVVLLVTGAVLVAAALHGLAGQEQRITVRRETS